jgi:hypothetical protein
MEGGPMSTIDQMLVSLIPSVLVAVITAVLTVRLSLRSFYSQKWWERKADSYSAIMQALYDVRNNLEVQRDAVERGAEIAPAYRKKLADKSTEGYEGIYRQAAMGAFTISPEAAEALRLLRLQLTASNKEMSLYDWLDIRASYVATTMSTVLNAAKKDLKVDQGSRFRLTTRCS